MTCLRTLRTSFVLSCLCLLTAVTSWAQEVPSAKPDLHQAIWNCDIAAVRELLDQGVNVNTEGPQGYTPLAEAVRAYSARDSAELKKTLEEIAVMLLAHGADPNASLTKTDHRTILQWYPSMPSMMLRLLLAHGANPNPKSTERSPLMVMASYGEYENVQAMVDAGARLEFRNPDGSTVLMQAAGWEGSDAGPVSTNELAIKVLDILLKKGARIDARDKYGDTALMYAAGAGHGPLVAYLVQHGANTTLRNRGRVDAFTLVADRGRSDPGVQALLQHGAKVGPVEALLMHEDDTFLKLLDQGADLHGRGPSGENLLIIAAEQGNLPIVQRLMTMGFKINSRDPRGETPLTLAVAGRPRPFMSGGWGFPAESEKGIDRLELVRFLLSKGADVNAKMHVGYNESFTALDVAEQAEAKEIVKLLKERGGKEANAEP